MKEEGHIEDETLGRWLAGDLSPEELKGFEASEAYATYQFIAEYSSDLSAPDFNEAELFAKIQSDRKTSKGKIVRMSTFKWVAAAASVIILLGIGSLFFLDWGGSGQNLVSVEVGNTETKQVVLPSKSKVELNAVSSIEYDKSSWNDERIIKLKGEGYFDVTKGSPFRVQTNSGTIAVLGTEFNIRERNKVLEVSCYEGKVKVTDTKSKSVILLEGQSAKITDGVLNTNWTPILDETPRWFAGESSFHEASLENVLIELENQYDINIQRSADYDNRLYTGAFIHKDLEAAAQMVFLPMQLSYEIVGDSLIVIK